MNIRDAFSAQAIALVHTEVASNKIAYHSGKMQDAEIKPN